MHRNNQRSWLLDTFIFERYFTIRDILKLLYDATFGFPGSLIVPVHLLYAAALLTSAWLWIYLIAAYTMRIISFLPILVRGLSNIMDFEEHPVRSLGYIAASCSAAVIGAITLLNS